MKQIIYKTYKSEQALLNQQGYFRAYFNQIRKDKSTTKFTKVKTSGYDSLLQEMYEYRDNEYICAGLNSFEREVVVVDNDDESFGKTTMDSLKSLGLVPHCQKVKANGHSQTYFFIEKYRIGSAGFKNGNYYENDFFENHESWKRLTKMMNYLFDGDLGYTGYNCQNPLYVNANVTSYRNIAKKYTFDELYNFCLSKLSDIENLDEFLRKMRRISMSNKHNTKNDKKYEIIYIFKNKQSNLSSINSVNNNKVNFSDIDVEATIDNAIKEQEKYINERIFISCCKTCKSFYQNGQLSYSNLDYISKTAYKDFTEVDFADGYACQELINRIRNDVRQIIYNNLNNKIDWNKVGYTNKQRELSLKIRRNKKYERIQKIEKILSSINSVNNNKVNFLKKNGNYNYDALYKYVEAEYYILYNEHLTRSTTLKDIKEIKEKNNKDSQSIQINSVNNNKVNFSNQNNTDLEENTNYIKNLASLALDMSNNNEESLYGNQN